MGGWEGTAPHFADPAYEHPEEVTAYTEEVVRGALACGMVGMLRKPPAGFEEVVSAHFKVKTARVRKTTARWKRHSASDAKGAIGELVDEVNGMLGGA